MSGDGISINLCFVHFIFCHSSLKKKDQFLQVTRLVMVMSLPVQMASVSRVAGGVILMMTVKITPMKKIVVSCICILW